MFNDNNSNNNNNNNNNNNLPNISIQNAQTRHFLNEMLFLVVSNIYSYLT